MATSVILLSMAVVPKGHQGATKVTQGGFSIFYFYFLHGPQHSLHWEWLVYAIVQHFLSVW